MPQIPIINPLTWFRYARGRSFQHITHASLTTAHSVQGGSTMDHSPPPPPVRRPATITPARAFDVPLSLNTAACQEGVAPHCLCQPNSARAFFSCEWNFTACTDFISYHATKNMQNRRTTGSFFTTNCRSVNKRLASFYRTRKLTAMLSTVRYWTLFSTRRNQSTFSHVVINGTF
jgi:hypothetical protein